MQINYTDMKRPNIQEYAQHPPTSHPIYGSPYLMPSHSTRQQRLISSKQSQLNKSVDVQGQGLQSKVAGRQVHVPQRQSRQVGKQRLNVSFKEGQGMRPAHQMGEVTLPEIQRKNQSFGPSRGSLSPRVINLQQVGRDQTLKPVQTMVNLQQTGQQESLVPNQSSKQQDQTRGLNPNPSMAQIKSHQTIDYQTPEKVGKLTSRNKSTPGKTTNPVKLQPTRERPSGSRANQIIKRHLPVHNKEEVFNEWAAVLQHQDEINSKFQQDVQNKQKNRQQHYKAALDQQYKEAQMRKQAAMASATGEEAEQLKHERQKLDAQYLSQENEKNLKLAQQRQNALNDLSEANQRKKQLQEIQRMENEHMRKASLQNQQIEQSQAMKDKSAHNQMKRNYRDYLSMQEKAKLALKQQDKDSDKIYAQIMTEKQERDEQERQGYFNNLKSIQTKNDRRHSQHMRYMKQDPGMVREQKDHQSWLKAMNDNEKKLQSKEHQERMQRDKLNQDTLNALNQQMKEKDLAKQNQVQADAILAMNIKQDVHKAYQKDQSDQLSHNQKMLNYKQSLNNQVKEQRKKKKYSVLMTEHERRVNDADIRAYEVCDTDNVYAMLPGYQKDYRQDFYIDKALNINEPSPGKMIDPKVGLEQGAGAGVGVGGSKGAILTSQRAHRRKGSSNLNSSQYSSRIKSNVTLQKSNNPYLQNQGSTIATLRGLNRSRSESKKVSKSQQPADTKKAANTWLAKGGYSPEKLEKVRRNMEEEDALKYRANTNNTNYGFEHTPNKPHQKFAQKETVAKKVLGSSPYEYNFTATGNYKP